MTLPDDLLARHPREGVRLVLRRQLAHVVAASRRVVVEHDPAALHDLRRMARELRVTVGSHAHLVPRRVARRSRKRLATLITATGLARDVEVALALLGTRHEAGCAQAIAHARSAWERRERHLRKRLARVVVHEVPRIERALDAALRRYRVNVSPTSPPLFIDEVRRAIEAAAERLQAALHAALENGSQPRADRVLHKARLAAKRLESLLQPFAILRTELRAVIAQLRGFEDAIGDLRDERLLQLALEHEALCCGGALRVELERLAMTLGRGSRTAQLSTAADVLRAFCLDTAALHAGLADTASPRALTSSEPGAS
ncbi:MAG: CHAD domain-containing protein [Polyangia bacterium]